MIILANLILSLSVVFTDLLLQIPMADTFRSEGKIYVLLAVVLIILLGVFVYLFRLDKKIKKLEDDIEQK